jgi:hypothetical protein
LVEFHNPIRPEMGSAVEIWLGLESIVVMSGDTPARYWPPGLSWGARWAGPAFLHSSE